MIIRLAPFCKPLTGRKPIKPVKTVAFDNYYKDSNNIVGKYINGLKKFLSFLEKVRSFLEALISKLKRFCQLLYQYSFALFYSSIKGVSVMVMLERDRLTC